MPDAFERVQLELLKRRVVQESKRNVFTHIVSCVHCGAKISYKNKTRATYMAAHNMSGTDTCTCHLYWPYPDFEKRVLGALVDYQQTSGIQYRNDMISRARALINTNHGLRTKLDALVKDRTELITLLDTYSLPELNKKLLETNSEIDALEATIRENDRLINQTSKHMEHEHAIDASLDVEDYDQRMELIKSVHDMLTNIAADMKARTATIHLRNDSTLRV